MNKVIRIISAVMVGILCFACFAACGTSVQPWTDKNVVFTYDNNGNVTIMFPDNYQYAKTASVAGDATGFPYVEYKTFREYLTEEAKSNNTTLSLYLVKIIRKLTVEECEKLVPRYSENEAPFLWSTNYEAVVLYDYLRDKEVNTEAFIVIGRREVGSSLVDCALYENGDTLIGMCTAFSKDRDSNYFYNIGAKVILDSEVTNDSWVYSIGKYGQEFKEIAVPLDEPIVQTMSNGTERKLVDKVKLSDFVMMVKRIMSEVGYEIK